MTKFGMFRNDQSMKTIQPLGKRIPDNMSQASNFTQKWTQHQLNLTANLRRSSMAPVLFNNRFGLSNMSASQDANYLMLPIKRQSSSINMNFADHTDLHSAFKTDLSYDIEMKSRARNPSIALS